MRSLVSFALGAATGAAAAHLLDPDAGPRRRAGVRDQVLAKARRGASSAQGQAQQAASRAKGVVADAAPTGARLEDADDTTLARKVETEIFRDADAPKGGVSVDVQAGVAYLRGEVPEEGWIARLGEAAEKVDGIDRVENLLHLPGTPAPTAEPRGVATERFG